MTKKERLAQYDEEPVFYCKDCLSLNIVTMDKTYDYCAKCGSSHVGVDFVQNWVQMYKDKYRKHPLY